MRIKKLYEWLNLPAESANEVKALGNNAEDVVAYLTELFQRKGVASSLKSLLPIIGIVARSAIEIGLNENNDFINFLTHLASIPNSKDIFEMQDAPEKFEYLYDRWRAKDFTDFASIQKVFGKEFIYNKSLYKRSLADFEYAFQALLLMSSKDGIKKYFDRPETVDTNMLFEGNGDIVSSDKIRELIARWSRWNDRQTSNKKANRDTNGTVEDAIRDELELDESERLTDTDVAKYVLSVVNKLNVRDIDKNAFEVYLDGIAQHRQIREFLKIKINNNQDIEYAIIKPFIDDFRSAWGRV